MADTTSHHTHSTTLQKLLSEDQDATIVRRVCAGVQSILENDEEILYVVIQSAWVAFTRDGAALTNKRLILYKPQLLGEPKLDAYTWGELNDARLHESRMFARLHFTTPEFKKIEVPDLPKSQARSAFDIAQEQIENVRKQREKKSTEATTAPARMEGVTDGEAAPDERTGRSRPLTQNMAPHPGV